MAELLPRVTECQNCGAPASANYCPVCGQDSRDHGVSVRLLLQDLAADVFTFDSRFFRSFVPLLLRPGELTVEYTRGRRVRYIPPLRLYVFVSLLFFFVLSLQVNRQLAGEDWFSGKAGAAADSTRVAEILAVAATFPDSLQASRGRAGWVAERLAAADTAEAADDSAAASPRVIRRTDGPVAFSFSEDEASPEKAKTVIAAAQSLIPKAVFVLQPLFAALLALVYWRRHRPFIEHLALSLHLHAFVFLVFTLMLIVPWDLFDLVVFLAINVYVYLALRRVYGQGWLKTGVKYVLLSGAYNAVIGIAVVLVFLSSAGLAGLADEHPTLVQWLLH